LQKEDKRIKDKERKSNYPRTTKETGKKRKRRKNCPKNERGANSKGEKKRRRKSITQFI